MSKHEHHLETTMSLSVPQNHTPYPVCGPQKNGLIAGRLAVHDGYKYFLSLLLFMRFIYCIDRPYVTHIIELPSDNRTVSSITGNYCRDWECFKVSAWDVDQIVDIYAIISVIYQVFRSTAGQYLDSVLSSAPPFCPRLRFQSAKALILLAVCWQRGGLATFFKLSKNSLSWTAMICWMQYLSLQSSSKSRSRELELKAKIARKSIHCIHQLFIVTCI